MKDKKVLGYVISFGGRGDANYKNLPGCDIEAAKAEAENIAHHGCWVDNGMVFLPPSSIGFVRVIEITEELAWGDYR